jgi:hypothetical protein
MQGACGSTSRQVFLAEAYTALTSTPVLCRATQLGGRFMMLRREATAVASMQQRVSGEHSTT